MSILWAYSPCGHERGGQYRTPGGSHSAIRGVCFGSQAHHNCKPPPLGVGHLTQYADRILFGLDMEPEPEAYRLYYRFLETDDEYFNYGLSDIPGQGRWSIYGLHLPDDILEKVYFRNAERVLFQRAEGL